MKTGIILLLCVGVLLFLIWGIRRNRAVQLTNRSDIHIFIPLTAPFEDTPRWLTSAYRDRWHNNLTCRLDLGMQTLGYVLSDGKSKMTLIISQTPLPQNLVEAALTTTVGLTNDEIKSLKAHKAYIHLHSDPDTKYSLDQIRLAVRVFLPFIAMPGALGYIVPAAQLYRSQTPSELLQRTNPEDSAFLYYFMTNYHLIKEDNGFVLHTHGMDQFALPDVQIRFTKEDQHQLYRELVADAAIYMIDRGLPCRPGETIDRSADNVRFRIEAVQPTHDEPLGAAGAIELVAD